MMSQDLMFQKAHPKYFFLFKIKTKFDSIVRATVLVAEQKYSWENTRMTMKVPSK